MTNTTSVVSAQAGAAIYSKLVLSVYDIVVIKFSNRWAWRCPSSLILDFYNEHISDNHLDVGPGTGYFLDKCSFASATPRIALVDLNRNSLGKTAERLSRFYPTTHLANILEPLQLALPKFDSIAVNYLLHCLPGKMSNKQKVFEHLKPWLNPGGVVFGTTILGQTVRPNFLARRLMTLYNARGVFSNHDDSLNGLETILKNCFQDYWVNVVGCVAFFTGRT